VFFIDSRYFQDIQKSLSSKNGKFEGWKPSSRVFGSGEGLCMGGIGSASTEETFSWLDSGSTLRVTKERCDLEALLLLLWFLWLKDPPAAISSCREDFLLEPNQK